jgi:D-alanine transfer protein
LRTSENLFFKKLLSISIAILLSLSIIISWQNIHPTEPIKLSSEHKNFYSNFDNSLVAKQDLYTALNYNNLVLFGSSELTNQNVSCIPNRFFSEQLGIPLLSFGHAGNQSFNYACEIAALKENQSSPAKVVIIVSPSWFAGKSGNGTSVTSFLEFISDDMLNKIMNDDSILVDFKLSLLEYIGRNFENIKSPTPFINYLYYQNIRSHNFFDNFRYFPLSMFYKQWVRLEKLLTSKYDLPKANAKKSINDYHIPSVNWDSLFQLGLDNEAKKCSNEFGVNDEYFEEYVKGNLPRVLDEIIFPNQELNDFKLLVRLCKHENIDALFVIQALNPYTYSNLHTLEPVLAEVKKSISDAGFKVFDMWQPSKEKYQKGLLTDVAHTGEYGWYQINREIYNHYFQKR